MTHYGPMMILDGREACSKHLNSERACANFIIDAVKMAEMQIASGPHVFREPPREAGKGPGITALVGLTESHAALHTYPEQGCFFFVMFSCRDFNTDLIRTYSEAFFEAGTVTVQVIPVGAEFPERPQLSEL